MIYETIGCPRILRCDYGTENVRLATTQIAFRLDHDDAMSGKKSFVYGPSTGNIVSFLALSLIY